MLNSIEAETGQARQATIEFEAAHSTPLLSKSDHGVFGDRRAVTEADDQEILFCQPALAQLTFRLIFISNRRSEPPNVGANIAGEEHPSAQPKEGNLTSAMPGRVDDAQAARYGEHLPFDNLMIDRCRLNIKSAPAE